MKSAFEDYRKKARTGQERYGDDLGPANLKNHCDQIVTEWSKRDSTRQKGVWLHSFNRLRTGNQTEYQGVREIVSFALEVRGCIHLSYRRMSLS